jgi:FtsP/CotA-like multicopper oxidase with cupredoxin domain
LGQTYSITLVNLDDDMYHNWVIADAPSVNANVLFNAQIGSAGVPVPPLSNQTATFIPTQTGNFYYLCQVHQHLDKGMWGQLTVTP